PLSIDGKRRLDDHAALRAVGIPGTGLEPAWLRGSQQLRRHVLFFQPGRLREGPAVRLRAAAGQRVIAPVEKLIGTYLKDDWRIGKQLSVSLGARYDWQNFVTDHNNVAPRFSFAYAPGGGKGNIIRGGAGYFYDRTGPVAIADTLQYRPGGLRRVVLTNPGYPDAFAGTNGLDSQPPSLMQFAPGMKLPYQVQYSIGFEHQLQKATTVSITYTGARGRDLFRSRDINAPTPASGYLTRPNPAYGVVRQIESAARQRTDSVQVMLRGKLTRWFMG